MFENSLNEMLSILGADLTLILHVPLFFLNFYILVELTPEKKESIFIILRRLPLFSAFLYHTS